MTVTAHPLAFTLHVSEKKTGLSVSNIQGSSSDFFLLLHASAMRRTAVGIAESADVNVQLSKSANEGAPVHSQHSGGFALMGILVHPNGIRL